MRYARTSRLLFAGMLASLALLIAPQASALAAPAGAAHVTSPVSASLRKFCATVHVPCKGQWIRVGHRSVYALSTSFALKGDGKAIPLVTGCHNEGYCTVSDVGGGKCWSDNSQSGNGVKVVLNNCDPNSAGQSWYVVSGYGGPGVSWIVQNNYECLNDPYGTNGSGTQQQIWNCYSTEYEDYGLTGVGPQTTQYLLAVDGENPSSGSSACLSDDGNSNSGAPLVIESCNSGDNQRWLWAAN